MVEIDKFINFLAGFFFGILGILEKLPPEKSAFVSIAFFALALFWYNTGRLFLIGWMVKLLWLVTITPLIICLWLFAWFVNAFIEHIRASAKLKTFTIAALFFGGAFCYQEHPDLLPFVGVGGFIYLYLLRYGLNEDKYKRWIGYLPRARKEPEPRERKASKTIKKTIIKEEQKAELLPKPVVKIAFQQKQKITKESDFLTLMDEVLTKNMR